MMVAQPVLSTKRSISGFDIYQDHQQKSTWYYSPPDVHLKSAATGSPAFLLLQMRYTGTLLYGDQSEKGFHNMLQLTIELEPLPTTTFDEIKVVLGRNINLKPLPVARFTGELIIPLGDAAAANEKYRKVSMNGVEASGESGAGAFWQERTFTMQLENEESQLLWDQMESGKLGVSFSYSFYSEAIPGQIGDLRASGSSEFASAMEEGSEDLRFDDQINTYLIKANTFPIHLQSKDFPNCLKKVDVNEEMPPAYAAFEVRCYDFADDLRPDLFKKIVEIKAYAAAKEFITTRADFSKNTRDKPSVVARFPYAIRLDHPLEFRITEINVNGEKSVFPWIAKPHWAEVIDVTTPEKSNLIAKRSLDFEFPMDSFQSGTWSEAICEIQYQLNQQDVFQRLHWTADDGQMLKTINFSCDRSYPIRYRIVKIDSQGKQIYSGYQLISEKDDFIFLLFPSER
jgi:hypothetical protein